MIDVRRLASLDDDGLDRLLDRGPAADTAVARTVAGLLSEIRREGDAAVRAQTLRFGAVEPAVLEVPRGRWAAALDSLDPGVRRALEAAAASIRSFHEAQVPSALEVEAAPGLLLGRRPDPLGRVGVYAPGGRAAYPSSVLMGVVPARVAGVGEVVVCSPPGGDGLPSPLVMAACAVAGADRLFAVGGAAAIGALAYGTETVPPADRVIGPGNAYVAEAKRQVSAAVGIDSPAGPSELLVLADDSADPETVAMELVAQAEHDPDAAALLVTPSRPLAESTARALARLVREAPRREIIEASLRANGALLVTATLAEAAAFATRYAPEHLLVLTARPRETLRGVRCAGTVFLGPRSSVAFGDYATGANHVLPTGGLARSYSGLSVDDFVRWTTWQEVGPAAAGALAAVAVPLAEAEGLPGHAAAARRAADAPASVDAPGRGAPGPERSAPGEAEPARRPVQPRPSYRAMTAYDPSRPPLPLDLSANTNLWGACPAALRAVGAADCLTTYPSVYGEPLKAALAGAWSVSPSQVVTGCGSDDLIDSAIRAFCPPGGTVAFPAPTFPMAPAFARMNGAVPRPVPLSAAGELTDDAVAVLAAADVVYLCRPNNPTGALIAAERVAEILDRARGLVLIDEAYGEYAGESLLEQALASERGVVLRTFSKAYGLAGLRVGYGLGPERLVRTIELSRGPYKVNAVAERAAVAAVEDGGDWIRRVVADTVANRGRLARELGRRGLEVREGRANFVLAEVPGGRGAAVKAGLASRGVGVRLFEGDDAGPDALRVTVGPWPLMERFLDALDGVR